MQKGSFTPKTPRYDTDGVVQRINALSETFRSMGLPVLVVQHDGTGSGEFEKNNWDWENLDDLQVLDQDIRLDKTANDIFYKSNLQATLSTLGVSELYITGCATDFCIEATVQSALTKDYRVTVAADGHTTADGPHLKAKQVIDHYNWVWDNMLPTQGTVSVNSSANIVSLLATESSNPSI